MNITKQFIKTLKEVENEMPMPKNTFVENTVFVLGSISFMLGINVFYDIIGVPAELSGHKPTVIYAFMFIALAFMLLYFSIR